jgi:RNA polymerase sigma factor (sigma-70 family)
MSAEYIHSAIEDTLMIEEQKTAGTGEYALVERCRDGDILAFKALYERYRRPLYSLAYRFHGNAQDAEDSLQEAFIRIYKALPEFRFEARLETWLYRVVMNTCISGTRAKRNREERLDATLADTLHSGNGAQPDAALRDLLERAIGQLPQQQRSVFLLYAVHGQTHADIADALGISVGTSKSNYHKAKEALKERLADYGIQRSEMLT